MSMINCYSAGNSRTSSEIDFIFYFFDPSEIDRSANIIFTKGCLHNKKCMFINW